MEDVRRNVNALDDVPELPLLVTRIGYMQQAARIKGVGQVRDEARIEAIVQPHVRAAHGAGRAASLM